MSTHIGTVLILAAVTLIAAPRARRWHRRHRADRQVTRIMRQYGPWLGSPDFWDWAEGCSSEEREP